MDSLGVPELPQVGLKALSIPLNGFGGKLVLPPIRKALLLSIPLNGFLLKTF